MADRPSFKEFVMTVVKRSVANWHGTEGWFALAAYFTILSLPLLATGLVADILGEAANKFLALAATFWLVVLFFIVTPFRMWQEEKYRTNLIEEAGKPHINVDWRFNERKRAEIIFTNTSTKTIEGIEVVLRNHRKADGSDIKDIMASMASVDGKRHPISMNPLVPTLFEFAGLTTAGDGNTIIVLMPGTEEARQVGKEVGVKLGFSGKDVAGSRIDLRLKVQDDGSLDIESWELGKSAIDVGIF